MKTFVSKTKVGLVPFDFRALEVFLSVAETKGFTAAANRLNLTQSAVSQIIGQLEKSLGSELFDRKTKPLALTVAGSVFHDGARALVEDALRLIPTVKEAAESMLPIIRVGMIDSLFQPLASVLGIELRTFADQVSIVSGFTHVHRAAFLNRDLDIAIMADAVDDLDGFERMRLVEEPLILLLPGSFRDKKCDDLEELGRQLPLVAYPGRSHIGQLIQQHLRRLGLNIPSSLAYGTSYGVAQMVAAGLGWAIVTPLCTLEGLAVADRTCCMPLPPPGISRRLTLVSRTGELGNIPTHIAAVAQQVIETSCVPEISRLMPWLSGQFKVGPI